MTTQTLLFIIVLLFAVNLAFTVLLVYAARRENTEQQQTANRKWRRTINRVTALEVWRVDVTEQIESIDDDLEAAGKNIRQLNRRVFGSPKVHGVGETISIPAQKTASEADKKELDLNSLDDVRQEFERLNNPDLNEAEEPLEYARLIAERKHDLEKNTPQ